MKLTAIVRGFQPSSDFPRETGPREFDAVDEFVAELARELAIAVPIVEGTLDDAPCDGLILIFDADGLSNHTELGPRIILINADRSNVLKRSEGLQLCAAVEKHRYVQWRTDRQNESGTGLFGRKDVAPRFGAVFSSGYQETQHYGLMSCVRCRDLPALLAEYLRAYVESTLAQ